MRTAPDGAVRVCSTFIFSYRIQPVLFCFVRSGPVRCGWGRSRTGGPPVRRGRGGVVAGRLPAFRAGCGSSGIREKGVSGAFIQLYGYACSEKKMMTVRIKEAVCDSPDSLFSLWSEERFNG